MNAAWPVIISLRPSSACNGAEVSECAAARYGVRLLTSAMCIAWVLLKKNSCTIATPSVLP
ncbi:hypothetical protein D3C85_1649950 [compost metagenome]